MPPDKTQKSLYADDDLAKWIEDTAEKSNRSESFVLNQILIDVMKSVDGKPMDIHLNSFKVEDNDSS